MAADVENMRQGRTNRHGGKGNASDGIRGQKRQSISTRASKPITALPAQQLVGAASAEPALTNA